MALPKRRKATLEARQTEKDLLSEPELEEENESFDPEYLIDTGSTLYNLANSDLPDGGFKMGRISNLIGDSNTGKSVLALTCLAECSYDKRFDKYQLINDDAEFAHNFNVKRMFGKRAKERIRFRSSRTIEEFYNNVIILLRGDPFILVLDSLDFLKGAEEADRAEDRADGKKISGTYGMERAKTLTEMLRIVRDTIATKESFLLVVSQTKKTIGFGSMFTPKYRTGADALKFASCQETWLSHIKEIKGKGQKITIGNMVGLKNTKNKLTGKKRSIIFPVYDQIGVDDIGSMIDFVCEEGLWKPEGQRYNASHFKITGTKEKLIKYVEDERKVGTLRKITKEAWDMREENLLMDRKPRFE